MAGNEVGLSSLLGVRKIGARAILTEDLDAYPAPGGGLSKAEIAFQHLHFDFGDKPFRVLGGTNELGVLPPLERAKSGQRHVGQSGCLGCHSMQGRQILVDSSTEYIQSSEPDVVVRVMTHVLREVRKRLVFGATAAGAKNGA
jgi:hypothetical protein